VSARNTQDVPRVTLMRYRVDLRGGSFRTEVLSPRHVEFPSVAPAVEGKRHRYVYTTPGPSLDEVSPQAGVLKTDCDQPSESQIWLPEPHQYCGEVLFTPRAASEVVPSTPLAEDDGYLLTLCFDGRLGTSDLLVFNAQKVDDGPICRLPVSDPNESLEDGAQIAGPGHGLHATFLPGMAPSLEQVQAAEARRGMMNARFLGDAPR
jgi:carotenoid cleavage dioxygenase-like enzyme